MGGLIEKLHNVALTMCVSLAWLLLRIRALVGTLFPLLEGRYESSVARCGVSGAGMSSRLCRAMCFAAEAMCGVSSLGLCGRVRLLTLWLGT